jgi:hypothetical protein
MFEQFAVLAVSNQGNDAQALLGDTIAAEHPTAVTGQLRPSVLLTMPSGFHGRKTKQRGNL